MGRAGRLLRNQSAHKNQVDNIENHYLGQKEGEHVGLGDPPSANEAIDVPKVNRMAATTKRVNFFISVSPRSLELLLAGETLRRFYENGTHVRKARDFAALKNALCGGRIEIRRITSLEHCTQDCRR